jgi:hypothetical protein
MEQTTLDTLDDLLSGVLEDVDEPDVRYKLRSARQLVAVIEHRHKAVDEAIAEAVDDEAIIETLRDLGYVE